MSNKRIEKFIPDAIRNLQRKFPKGISSEEKGYITSFGPSVITAGLKNTLMIYKLKSEKEFVCSLLDELVQKEIGVDAIIFQKTKIHPKTKEEYLDAITALKLASRVIQEKKDEQDEK